MKDKTQNVIVTILNETVESIKQNCELTGMSPGELIDRAMLKFSPQTPELAAQIILESISTSIRLLDEEQINIAMRIVFIVIQQGFEKDGLHGLVEMVDNLEEMFPETDYDFSDEYFDEDE